MNANDIPDSKKRTIQDTIDRSSPDGCWPWTNKLNAAGRGRVWISGKQVYAYRAALAISGTEVPDDQPVRHICGNPACCRPDHLTVEGGQRENNLDTVGHGRHATAKLDDESVCEMRKRYACDRPPLRELADDYGVGESAVSAALTGRTWPRAGGPIKRSRKLPKPSESEASSDGTARLGA